MSRPSVSSNIEIFVYGHYVPAFVAPIGELSGSATIQSTTDKARLLAVPRHITLSSAYISDKAMST
jgi:hypothetical protein